MTATDKDWIVERVEHTGDPAYPIRVIGTNLSAGGEPFRWAIPAASLLNPRYSYRAAVFTEEATKIMHACLNGDSSEAS